jgi:hypothetical protein
MRGLGAPSCGCSERIMELATQPNAALGALDPGRIQKTIDTVAYGWDLFLAQCRNRPENS